MSQRSRYVLGSFLLAVIAAPAAGLEVRGVVMTPQLNLAPAVLGYTRTPVAQPSSDLKRAKAPAAVFLKAKDSLPLPPPSAKWPLALRGLRLEPSVLSCAVDESVQFTNHESSTMTLVVGSETLQPLAPGASLEFLCQHAGTHGIKVQEWPHLRGTLFIGEVGVASGLNADGKFAVSASAGTYDLVVVGSDGVLLSVPVTVGKTDVDLGRLGSGNGEQPAPAAPGKVEPAPAADLGGDSKPKPAAAPPAPAKPKPPQPAPPASAGDDTIKLEP